ncbi:MAG: hypothetical protein OXC13_01290 [Caldilineaceae bacterium]|nr:hypothetical protein [Caldilineaceae bacterium]
MHKSWRGGRSHATNQTVADAGFYTAQVRYGRGRRIAIPLKGTHLPSGALRIILQRGESPVHGENQAVGGG